ncbi:MAG: ribonuclease H-like domain-containing protein [Hyphomicrobiaceae bacterium]
MDRLLRGKVFVDLYGVVRRAVRASVESYSLKRLEPFYGFGRETELPDANAALLSLQTKLERGDVTAISEDAKATVQSYNRDDCVSAARLHTWLVACPS